MAPIPGTGGSRPGWRETVCSARGVVKSFNSTLRELLVSDILVRFCERLPYAFVILWAMNHGGVSAKEYGLLFAI